MTEIKQKEVIKILCEAINTSMTLHHHIIMIDTIGSQPCFTKQQAYNKKRRIQKLARELMRLVEKARSENKEESQKTEKEWQKFKKEYLDKIEKIKFPIAKKSNERAIVC